MASCAECGLDEAEITLDAARDALRTFPRRYREALTDLPDSVLRERPDPATWSMLEYAVHAREVLELLAGTLPIVLSGSRPAFPPIDVDEVAAGRPAWVMDAGLTLAGIATACDAMAGEIVTTPLAAWDRAFMIGDLEHTAEWIPRHAAHEGAHHLRDIDRVRAAVTRRATRRARRP